MAIRPTRTQEQKRMDAIAAQGGGGGTVTLGAGLEYDQQGRIQVKLGTGLAFDQNGAIVMAYNPVVNIDHALVYKKE